MKPSLDQYEQSCATWKRWYKGIGYTLSHHGISECQEEGIWCFYIHLLEEMFINPDDFSKFDREPVLKKLGSDSIYETYDYYDVPDYGFHGGITFYDRTFYVSKDGKKYKSLKIGCDYNHLWDAESGYWQSLENVDYDCKSLIDKLVMAIPQKIRCGYSGKVGMPEEFYEAKNGLFIHKSYQQKLLEDGWDNYLPKQHGLDNDSK